MGADGTFDDRLGGTLYDRLGVDASADLAALRTAYRRRARELHPDLHRSPEGGDAADGPAVARQLEMALVNEAWAVLSDPTRRAAYDRTLVVAATAAPTVVFRPAPPRRASPTVLGRKEAWIDGVRVRIRFLGTMAGRSAVQTLLLRHPGTARTDWEAALPPILDHLGLDTVDRVKGARAAGAAPLDLANAAALIGLVSYGTALVAGAAAPGRGRTVDDDVLRRASMVDRMFDTLAHELPRGLVRELGDNPRVARRLGARR